MKKLQFLGILHTAWSNVAMAIDDLDYLVDAVKIGSIKPCAARKMYKEFYRTLTHHGNRFCALLDAAQEYDKNYFKDWTTAPYWAACGRFEIFFK